MKKLFYILPVLFLLLLGSCRSDEPFKWNNREVRDDEYILAFIRSDYSSIRDTRSEEPAKAPLLLIFESDEVDAQIKKVVDLSNYTVTKNGEINSVTLKQSDVQAGNWLLVQNFGVDKIVEAVPTKTDIYTVTLAEFNAIKFNIPTTESDAMVYRSELRAINPADLKQAESENVDVFELKKPSVKVSLIMNTDQIPFIVTGVDLYYQPEYVKMGAEMQTVLKDLGEDHIRTCTDADKTNEIANTFTDKNGAEKLGLRYGKALSFYAAPIANEGLTLEGGTGNEKGLDAPYLIVKGYVADKDENDNWVYDFGTGKELFFAKKLPALPANSHLQASITGSTVTGGSRSRAAAVENPVGLNIEFKVESDRHESIVSDGENALAVTDSIKIGHEGSTVNDVIHIKVRSRYNNETLKDFLQIRYGGKSYYLHSNVGNKIQLGWCSLQEPGFGDPAADDNSFYNYDLTLTVDAGKNEGSARNEKITVTLLTEKDNNGKFLSRDVVIFQDKDDKNTADKIFKISANIQGKSVTDYLSFIGSNGDTSLAYGILPSANDGRVRNNGLHIPFHYTEDNGTSSYTYSVKLQSAIECTKWELFVDSSCGLNQPSNTTGSVLDTTTTWSFTANENNSVGYAVYPEAIKLVVTNGTTQTEYSLDVYRTGFFHEKYYYEVFEEGTTGRFWLDRNWGAKSAGLAVNNGGSFLSDTRWPLNNGSAAAGEFCSKGYSSLPDAWRIPTIAEISSLTSATGFTISQARTYESKSPYYSPSYGFTAKTIIDGVSTEQTIRTYFPLAMMKTNNSWAGNTANGYYLTSTEDGENDGNQFYQIMQFDGVNTTAVSLEMTKAVRTVSLRPCAGAELTAQGAKYTLNVQGYTHVYVYAESAAGRRTVLTPWPGTQIAICGSDGTGGTMGRYNSLTLNTPVVYDKLYIICNVVGSNGKRFENHSNVSEADVAARKGVLVIFKDELTSEIKAPLRPTSLNQVASIRKINEIAQNAAKQKAAAMSKQSAMSNQQPKKVVTKKANATRANNVIERIAFYRLLEEDEVGYTTQYRAGSFGDYTPANATYTIEIIGHAIDTNDKFKLQKSISDGPDKYIASFEIEPGTFHIKITTNETGNVVYHYASGNHEYDGSAVIFNTVEKSSESGTEWTSSEEGWVEVSFYPETNELHISERKKPHYHVKGPALTGSWDRSDFAEMTSTDGGLTWTYTGDIKKGNEFCISRYYTGPNGTFEGGFEQAEIIAKDETNSNIIGNGTYQGHNSKLGDYGTNFVSKIAGKVTLSYDHITRKLTISGYTAPAVEYTYKLKGPAFNGWGSGNSTWVAMTPNADKTEWTWTGDVKADEFGIVEATSDNTENAFYKLNSTIDADGDYGPFNTSDGNCKFKEAKNVTLTFNSTTKKLHVKTNAEDKYDYYLSGPAFVGWDTYNDNNKMERQADGSYKWTGKPNSGQFGIARFKKGSTSTDKQWIYCSNSESNKTISGAGTYSCVNENNNNGANWTNNITTNATFTFTPTSDGGTLKVVAEAQLKELGFRWYPIMSKLDGGSYSFESLGNHIYAQLNNGNDYWMESGNGLTGTIQEEGYYLATTDNTGELKQISWGGSVDYSDSNHWRKASAEDAKKCGVKVLYDIRKQTTSYKNLNFIYWINRLSGASRDYTGGIDLYDGDFVTGGTLHRNNAVQMSTSKMYYYVAATITIDNGGTIVLRNSSDDTKVMQFANHTKERSDIAWFVGAQTAIQITSVNEISDESDNNRSSRSVSVTHKKMPALSPAAQAAAAKARKR